MSSSRGRGDSRGHKRHDSGSRGGSRPSTPSGHDDSSPRSRSPQRPPSPTERGGRGTSPTRAPHPSGPPRGSSGPPRGSSDPSRGSSGPSRGTSQHRGDSQVRGGPPHQGRGSRGSHDAPRREYHGGSSEKVDKSVMFTNDQPSKEVSDHEKKTLESKNNIPQAPQRELRESKSKAQKDTQKRVPLARRAGYGTKGKAVTLRSNFFTLSFKPGATFYAYQVKIVPEPKLKRHIKQIFRQLVLKCTQIKGCLPATDEAQWIITCIELPFKSTYARCDPDENKVFATNYEVHFELQDNGPIPLQGLLEGLRNPDIHEKVSDEDYVVNLLNIFMMSSAYGDDHIAIVGKGRLKVFYFDDKLRDKADQKRQDKADLTGGLDVVRGCISSVRPAGNRLLLNLGVSNSAFYQPIQLSVYIEEVLKSNYRDMEMLNRYLRNVKIEMRYMPKIYNDFMAPVYKISNVWGLASQRDVQQYEPPENQDRHPPIVNFFGAGPDDVQFWYTKDKNSPGRYVTVTKFFAEKHGITLKDRKKPVVNIGNHKKAIYIPSELVWIQDRQAFNGELSTSQRQNIIKFSCRVPPENYKTIMTLGRNIMGMTGSDHFYQRQIKFSDDMVVVPARVLDPPTLKYGTRSERPQRGSWNLVGKQFSSGTSADIWAGLWIKTTYTRTTPDEAKAALESFKKKLAEMGVRLGKQVALNVVEAKGTLQEQNDSIKAGLMKMADLKVNLLLIVLPTGQDRIFRYVKWQADCKLGIPNHCVLINKFAGGSPQYMANNALKVNLKLGGTNHTLDTPAAGILAQGKTMVVGIDATHPSPTDCDGFPTCASIVASTDGRLSQWPGEIRLQASKQEILQDLRDMILGRLHRWQKVNKTLPMNIIIYRDGVSEGQYGEVVTTELNAVRQAIERVYKGPSPKITLLIVTKRHHVRFYPTSADGCDEKSNCKNGTIVDRNVTRPCYWDFYLQAQAPLQGSARPAHYVVLYDEIFSASRTAADDLQQLTHNICYMMARCTRSVSYSTPAFLADRYCDRGRRYIQACYEEKQLNNPNEEKIKLRPKQEEVTVHPRLAETMVYI